VSCSIILEKFLRETSTSFTCQELIR